MLHLVVCEARRPGFTNLTPVPTKVNLWSYNQVRERKPALLAPPLQCQSAQVERSQTATPPTLSITKSSGWLITRHYLSQKTSARTLAAHTPQGTCDRVLRRDGRARLRKTRDPQQSKQCIQFTIDKTFGALILMLGSRITAEIV